MVTREKLYTADDLWEISHDDDERRYELVEGVIYDMPPAGGLHGNIAMILGWHIAGFVMQNDLGFVTAAETGFSLTGDNLNVLAPDVGFISKNRLATLPEGYIPLAPDLAVEVVSPNDKADVIHRKIVRYLEAGTQQVWLVYPKDRHVVIHTSAGTNTLKANDTLIGGDILPGFKLPLNDIFSQA
jgi:Uma2 family endonuclease